MEIKELTQNFNVVRVENGFILYINQYNDRLTLPSNANTFVFRNLKELALFIEHLDDKNETK